jgi:hypothetical protein
LDGVSSAVTTDGVGTLTGFGSLVGVGASLFEGTGILFGTTVLDGVGSGGGEEFRPKGKIPHIEAWDLAHLRDQQWINQLRIVELWGAGDQSAVGALEAFVIVPTVEPSVNPATRRVVLLARPIAPWSAPGVASSAAAGAPSVVLLPDRVSEEQEIADAMAALRPYLGSIGLNKPSG